MKFIRELDPTVQIQVEECDRKLHDPARLAAVNRSGLLDSDVDEAFERLARLAASVLKVPLTIISLVSDRRQYFMAGHGLPAPFDVQREVQIDSSICRYTLNNTEIVAEDGSKHALLMSHPTTGPWNIGAFISIPMLTYDNQVLGSFCAINQTARPWSEADVQFMREMTTSVMTEIRLREEIRELDSEKKMREHFVATLTHDLLNPIGVIKGSAELLSDSIAEGTSEGQLLRMISNNSARAEAMIRDLLNVSSVRAGQATQIAPTETNFKDVVEQVRDSLLGAQREFFMITGASDIIGSWDAVALRRIIDNLVSNAFKYGEAKTPVTLDAHSDASGLRFSVHNFGTPIPQNSLRGIFDSFSRTQTAREGQIKGWGIGLALVKALTEAHGGQVEVTSSEAGTRFLVTLPLRKA